MSFGRFFYIFGLIVATHGSRPLISKRKNFSNIDIAEEMKKAGIVPKIIPTAPTKLLNVILSTGELFPGSIIFFDDDEHIPSMEYEVNNTNWHALIVTAIQNWDPDEKLVSRTPNSTRPEAYPQEETITWVLANIRGNAALYGDEYFNRPPPLIEGDTQIVNLELYLLYEQPGKLNLTNRPPSIRDKADYIKSVRDFAAQYAMTGPIAGNFLFRRWQRQIEFVHQPVQ